MFNIGLPEIVIIVGLALLVVGPKRLPELAKSLGKGLKAFRNAADDVKDSFNVKEDDPAKP